MPLSTLLQGRGITGQTEVARSGLQLQRRQQDIDVLGDIFSNIARIGGTAAGLFF